jgi:hypothetical protein
MMLAMPFNNSMATIGKEGLLRSAKTDLQDHLHQEAVADLAVVVVVLAEDLLAVEALALEVAADLAVGLAAAADLAEVAAATLDPTLVASKMAVHQLTPIPSPTSQPLDQREARLSMFAT